MASTIKDVAKMADVSISTVSRVINDSKPVSPEARRRVLKAIEVLDYKPNEVARS
ncbi:transcriptional regulator, LacI family, partial [Peptoniphilus duerdenii ATCC BAA-1640]